MQTSFFNQVRALENVIEEMGNPFIDKSNDLLVLDTRDIADTSVVNTIQNLQKTRKKQYDTFVTERLTTPVQSIYQ